MTSVPVIFISYDTDEALQHAKEAKRHLEAAGYRTWVWCFDRAAAGYVQEEMAKNICASDYFLLICTAATTDSKAQTYEREMAWYCDKLPPLVITFDPSHVPLAWRCYLRNYDPKENLQDQCTRISEYLRGQQQLTSHATGVQEGLAIKLAVIDGGTGTESVVVEKGEPVEPP